MQVEKDNSMGLILEARSPHLFYIGDLVLAYLETFLLYILLRSRCLCGVASLLGRTSRVLVWLDG